MARHPKTITIAAWCPSLNPVGSTAQGLLTRINNPAEREQCIRTLKFTLQTPLVFVHNKEGHVFNDFSLLKDNDVVVVTTDYFESPKNMWTKELQEGHQTDAWLALTRTQRCDYMESLPCRCCNGKHTKIVPTFPNHIIRSSSTDILAQGLPSLDFTSGPPAISTLATMIRESWGRTIDEFMGPVGFVRPAGAMESWDPALLPTLALLADATAGQVELVHEATMQMIKRRGKFSGNLILTTADLHQVIGTLIGGSEVYLEDTDGEEEKGRVIKDSEDEDTEDEEAMGRVIKGKDRVTKEGRMIKEKDRVIKDSEDEGDEYEDADTSGFDWSDI
ncbi:hypothetical protein T440DRAFT_499475 [Plenodomus tracheiphilus IPT5]|uniref:Uncharacterized protein n=1 Tax=Plenodomus tracheiphilus IPT5 TaxID=1408161 RepID=A0A6A7B6K0_9PLEO|nr:hypothetical protein T440DRAFT_499475 [Plenodomus tracheiphilus IPT5]